MDLWQTRSMKPSVSAGKCIFSSMACSNTILEENNITEIDKIEFNFCVYDKDGWSGNDSPNETITLNP